MNELINASSATRTLKVRYAYYDHDVQNPYPIIQIAGKYLRSYGFEIGRHVEIHLSAGRITIDLIPNENPEDVTFSSTTSKANKI